MISISNEHSIAVILGINHISILTPPPPLPPPPPKKSKHQEVYNKKMSNLHIFIQKLPISNKLNLCKYEKRKE